MGMIRRLELLGRSLNAKLILTVGLTLLTCIAAWAYFNVNYQRSKAMQNIVAGTDRLTNTVRLGTHYAMMLNSRDDITQIILNVARLEEIENIRIYNKAGEIKYSNRPAEVDHTTNIKAEACYICHKVDPPVAAVSLAERIRIFNAPGGGRLLGIISPIRNETGCASDSCHVHPADKKILGALDLVVSLAETDREIVHAARWMIGLAISVFVVISAILFVFTLKFVNQPVKKMIDGTRRIARGEYDAAVVLPQRDEMGQLSTAINRMGTEIGKKQTELNKQRDEYQTLFEMTPCMITVQDTNYRLLRYNQEFAQRFAPELGATCYEAYKGTGEKCVNCPVERTFQDGCSHTSEESGVDKNGDATHWILRTSPIKDEGNTVVAAMEIALDITDRKRLEEELARSERKYHEIFNNIPNPVFVLSVDSLTILDCNDSVQRVYGYTRGDLNQRSFLELFLPEERDYYSFKIVTTTVLNKVRQVSRSGNNLFVTIRISLHEYLEEPVLLVTTSDITKRLQAEQQLIQASKMATLGEMATGVAHELNQPLSVIKTASSFFLKKIHQQAAVNEETLNKMLTKIDSNVDRAAKIINHMRQFARKSDQRQVRVQVNDVLKRAFEIFSQQLKVRGIAVAWEIDPKLPSILADPDRLEQVFINLLLNARDAIETRWARVDPSQQHKRISLRSFVGDQRVCAEVADTGHGIDDEIAQKIFEPFFTTKEVGKGTGLGLSISYGIVKDCRGDIEVRANRDGGATFRITFPAAEVDHEYENSAR